MKARYLAAAAALVTIAGAAAAASITPPAWINAVVMDSARPKTDTDRDAARKPAEVLTFAQVKRGSTVLELIPGGGYFTRLLSLAVGPRGHVTEAIPIRGGQDMSKASNGVAADPHFKNVSEMQFTPDAVAKAGPVDLVFTAQNYHDLHLKALSLDVVGLDKQIFAALKPGGEFFIEDHAATAGSGLTSVDTLHRIDEAVVKQEVESVGFKLVAESDLLHNPDDDHTKRVFDPAIRGHTDQFLLVFRKPK
jgi:predicted methyltransferase